jgi:hypothetical protein
MRTSILAISALAACGGVEAASAGHDAGQPDTSWIDASEAMEVDASAGPIDASAAMGADGGEGPADTTASENPSDGATWSPPLHGCELSPVGFVQDPPSSPGPSLTCPGSSQVVLSNPQVVGPDGGAIAPIAPGAMATVSVLVTSQGSQGLGYPCLALATDNPAVTVGAGGPTLYSLNPRAGVTYAVNVTFGSSIAPGTRVRFAAWAGWSGGVEADGAILDCVSAPALLWDVAVYGR